MTEFCPFKSNYNVALLFLGRPLVEDRILCLAKKVSTKEVALCIGGRVSMELEGGEGRAAPRECDRRE